MPSYEITVKNSSGTITATFRPTYATARPSMPKNFTQNKLLDGSLVVDVDPHPYKRRFEYEVEAETDTTIKANLKALYDLTESVYLDDDAYLQVSNLECHFENLFIEEMPGGVYRFTAVLQEL